MRLAFASACSPARCSAQSGEQLEFFEKRVRPLFAAKCYACHGDKVQMGGLELVVSRRTWRRWYRRATWSKSRLYGRQLRRKGEDAAGRAS